jgi:hypothetical protein
MQFGLGPDQVALALEDIEQVVAAREAADDKQKQGRCRRGAGREAPREPRRAARSSSARSRHDRARGPELPVLLRADACDRR